MDDVRVNIEKGSVSRLKDSVGGGEIDSKIL